MRSPRQSIPDALQKAFSETSDPDGYVPRIATEALLERLDHWSRGDGPGSSLASILAPPGLGKTILLRVCEQRLNARAAGHTRALYLPYAGLGLPDLSTWVHGLLGRPLGVPGAENDPLAALAALCALGAEPDEPFFLLIDDADSMPQETLRTLADGLPRERSPLRLLMATGDDAKASRMLANFVALQPLEAELGAAMTAAETEQYLQRRLAWAGRPPAECQRVAEVASRIHALSAGNPRQVHRVAEAILAAPVDDDLATALDAKQRRENWLGRPIEDDL